MFDRWWVAEWYEANPVLLYSWIIWVIASITLHELSHGWTAIRCGDDVPIHSGHMTLNPLVHIPFPWAWIMFAVFGFTWGLMPVQPANFRGRYDDAKVAFAGPAMNLILAALCLVLDVAWLTWMTHVADPFHLNVHTFLWTGLMINVMGFVFNLLPVPPLDGSRILGDFFPRLNEVYRGERWPAAGPIAFVLLFLFGSRIIWPIVIAAATILVELGLMITGGEPRRSF